VTPNLASSSFYLYFKNIDEEPAELRIFDYLNHQVLYQQLDAGSLLRQFDCSQWSSGVYNAVVNQNGKSFCQRVIVSR